MKWRVQGDLLGAEGLGFPSARRGVQAHSLESRAGAGGGSPRPAAALLCPRRRPPALGAWLRLDGAGGRSRLRRRFQGK